MNSFAGRIQDGMNGDEPEAFDTPSVHHVTYASELKGS